MVRSIRYKTVDKSLGLKQIKPLQASERTFTGRLQLLSQGALPSKSYSTNKDKRLTHTYTQTQMLLPLLCSSVLRLASLNIPVLFEATSQQFHWVPH